MKKVYVITMLAALVMVSCAPQQSQIQTAIAATKAYEGDLATALAGTLAAGVQPSATAIESTATAVPSPTAALGIGSTYLRPADGVTMLFVPAGEFTMGWNDGAPNEKPEHQVTLDAYWIDGTEVTNAAYGRCVSSGPCTKAGATGNPEAAVISVPWQLAQAYCSWAGARLPTEAEWEKAARGTDGRLYPWGNDSDPSRYAPMGWDNTVEAAGSYPAGASPYGVLDMAGSAFEWVSDWYSGSYYSSSPSSNPSGPASGQQHVIRGGWWEWCPSYYRCTLRPTVRSTYRNGTGNYGRGGSGPAWIYYPWAGFRCADSDIATAAIPGVAPAAQSTSVSSAGGPTTRAVTTALPGTIPIEYGETKVSIPRQGTLLYGFQGTQGDNVIVRLELSNAHPKMTFCNRGMSSNFRVQTDALKTLEASGLGPNASTTKAYQLPYTGRYYILASCAGPGCDAFCAQLDLTVEKK